jgi:hypothetical protein
MKESDFNSNVNAKLDKSTVFSWKINDNFQGGVPDNFYLGLQNVTIELQNPKNGRKLPLFVEYKYLKAIPKRDTTSIIPDLSAQQLKWLQMLIDAGQLALVIVGAPSGRTSEGVIFESHEWVEGITRAEFIKRMKSYAELAKIITEIVNSVA